jgi:manganese-dependent inorganic pyrophosphatase
MAGLMLAAILSDTMLLKSPTTTEEDKQAVKILGEILDEDPLAFGRQMYSAKFDMAALSAREMISNDLKRFAFDSHTVAVAQIEAGDKELLLARKEEILQAMRAFREEEGLDLMVLLITDIPRGGTELLAVGQTRVVERAFGATLQENALYLPGVMSRKKQVIPRISHSL